ncbi:DUF3373 family protein [Haliangium ochraceum]|nr:DUF3373 family protein [Haliangium ochraceum]
MSSSLPRLRLVLLSLIAASATVAGSARNAALAQDASATDGYDDAAGTADGAQGDEVDAMSEDAAFADDDLYGDLPPEEQLFDHEERLSYLEEAMDVVEKRATLDRLQFGLDYRLIFNAFVYKGANPDPLSDGSDISRTSGEIWSHQLRVPFLANITPNLRFTARLSMFKHFGDDDQALFFQDFQGSRVPRDTALRVEQAWLDWFATDYLSLSGGRLSYMGRNPPGELREHTGYRIPTWGLQMVDGEYDVVTATLQPLREVLPEFYLQGFYGSWFSDFDDPRGEFAFLSDGRPNGRIIGAIADLKVPKLPRSYLQIGYLGIPRFRALRVPIPDPLYNPDDDFTNAPPPFNGSLLFPSVLPDTLGGFHSLNFLAEVLDLPLGGDLSLDAFFGGTLIYTRANDEAIHYELPNPATGERVDVPVFVFVGQGSNAMGASLISGLRLGVPVAALPEPLRIGLEYNYGSRYSLSFAVPNEQFVSKWTVRGHAYEGYVIVPVYRDRMFLRTGFLFIDHDFWNGLLGLNPATNGGSSVPRRDMSISNFNVLLQVRL